MVKRRPKRDMALGKSSPELEDVARAIGLLTRLPVPVDGAAAQARGAGAAWAYPVAGGLVALLGLCLAWGALWFGVPATIAAALALGLGVVVTGALHEDGLADSADGLWGGWDKDRRLEIMKDSRIGAYGVLALVFGTVIRWQALVWALTLGIGGAWIAAAMVGRAAMPVLMASLPQARPGGLSASVGRPSTATAGLACALCAPAVLWFGFAGVGAALVAGLCAFGCARLARAKIGGQTGDILGATGLICEAACLVSLLASSA